MHISTSLSQSQLKLYHDYFRLSEHDFLSFQTMTEKNKEEIQSTVGRYYAQLASSHQVSSNLFYSAFRNHSTKDKIINHYLTSFFKELGITCDTKFKQALMIAIARSDAGKRLYYGAQHFSLTEIQRLHLDVLQDYIGLDKRTWNASIFTMPFSDILWIGNGSLLYDMHNMQKQYWLNDKYPLDVDLQYKLDKYMKFMKAAFYTDNLLQNAILALPDQEKSDFFKRIKLDMQGNPWLQSKWLKLIESNVYSPMLREMWGDSITLDSQGKVFLSNKADLNFCYMIEDITPEKAIQATENDHHMHHGQTVLHKRENKGVSDEDIWLYTTYTSLNLGREPVPVLPSAQPSGYITDESVLFYTSLNLGHNPIPTLTTSQANIISGAFFASETIQPVVRPQSYSAIDILPTTPTTPTSVSFTSLPTLTHK